MKLVVFDLKKRFIISLVLLTLSLSLFVFATWGWFTQLINDGKTYTIGDIDVEIIPFFVDNNNQPIVDGNGDYIIAPNFEMITGVTKQGVYGINIINSQLPYYFQNLRVLVRVKSTVNTYIRVKIYEQLTWRFINSQGVLTEVAVLDEDGMPFSIDTDWFDDRALLEQESRELTYYVYYQIPVIRNIDETPNDIMFILGATSLYQDYAPGYYFQLSFEVEAVQEQNGPQNVWNLSTPPWGGSW